MKYWREDQADLFEQIGENNLTALLEALMTYGGG